MQNEDDKVRLSFAIGGFVRVIKDYLFEEKKQTNAKRLAECISAMIELLLKKKRLALEGKN